MAVVVPHTQDLTLAWTPTPAATDAMKRATTSPGPAETKDSKKRRRADTGSPVTPKADPIKREAASESDGDYKTEDGSPRENDAGEANGDAQWPTLARKRQRMTEEERKARHREVQRQFMQRKLAKLDEMRKLVVVLEKQFMLLQLSQERARLEHENDYLHRRVLANPPHWTHEHPHETQQRLRQASLPRPPPAPPAPHAHPHHQFHHQVHPQAHARPHAHHAPQGHRPPTGMLPWDEILEAVSEANV